MSHFFREFWPQILCVAFIVGVCGNLVASMVLGVPALLHLHRKLDRQHAERLALQVKHHRQVMGVLRGGKHLPEEGT